MNIRTPRNSDKTLLRRLDIFFLTFGILDFTAPAHGASFGIGSDLGFTSRTETQGPMQLSPTQPETYFFQALDLIKIQKIIKCETSTKGA